jgi:flagellar assembly factor FliW
MPSISILGTELPYDDSNIITFEEGLIGMPHLKYMVLVAQSDIAPFFWLASLDDPRVAFLVADPRPIFAAYDPIPEEEMHRRLALNPRMPRTLLSIVKISSDWAQTTFNLRAPIFISPETMKAAQIPLSDRSFQLEEPLPVSSIAA